MFEKGFNVSDQIKNRVVGAIVLFTLAIIFLPKIFDGEKETQRREFVAIPKKPVHQVPNMAKVVAKSPETAQISPPVDINNKATVKTPVKTVEKEKIAVKSKPAPVVVPKKSINAQAWVIKMGSFGNPNNVKAFVLKLRKKGFTAFSVPTVPKAGIVNKVYVGPELKKNALVKLQPKLKQAFNESGVIVKYKPLQ